MAGKAPDMSGRKFGLLRVTRRAGSNARQDAMWLCRCDCGRSVTVRASSLRDGNTHSCGCVAKSKHWTSGEIRVLSETINTVPYSRIATMLPGRTVDAIKQRATILDIEREGARFSSIARNEDFFAQRTLTSAYWAGFIAADGCIVTSPRREVRISLNHKDIEQLRRFATDSGFEGRVAERNGLVYVTVCAADRWISDLARVYKVGSRKTFDLKPPNISGDEALAYIAGYIDGDGCWHIGRTTNLLQLVVVGTEQVLDWIDAQFRLAGASVGNTSSRRGKGCYRRTWTGSHARSIAGTILSLRGIRLMDRKWSIAKRGGSGAL